MNDKEKTKNSAYTFRYAIRYGLQALKNVGEKAIANIIDEREKNGDFKSIYDFFKRINKKNTNKRQLESLIAGGALDVLDQRRWFLYHHASDLLRWGEYQRHEQSLFSEEDLPPILDEVPDWSHEESLEYERASIGFYLSSHPLMILIDDYEKLSWTFVSLKSEEKINIEEQAPRDETEPAKPQYQNAVTGATLVVKKEKSSKTGKRFAFLQLSDPHGSYEVSIFDPLLSQWRDRLIAGESFVWFLSGTIREQTLSWRVNSIDTLENTIKKHLKSIKISLELPEDQQILFNLCQFLSKKKDEKSGGVEICMTCKNTENILSDSYTQTTKLTLGQYTLSYVDFTEIRHLCGQHCEIIWNEK